MNSIIQDWAAQLGLRHQGVLVSAVRGVDGAEKEDGSKRLARFYRACVLKAHVGDARKATSFMLWCDTAAEFNALAAPFLSSFDQYPNHYVMHLLHAAEICGYYHDDPDIRRMWNWFYFTLVHKMHLNPETQQQLDLRLNADEEIFKRQQEMAADETREF